MPERPEQRAHGATLGGVLVGRIAGIDIRLHASWFLWLVVLTIMARGVLVPEVTDSPDAGIAWALAVLLAVPLSLCIVAHELAHALIARAYGLRVRGVTLFMFGGVAQIEREAPGPGAEFRIALAGPLVSLLIGSALALTSRILNAAPEGIPTDAWGTFALFNLVLAMFNLVPAFPMDGGRILRSALWAAGGGRARATRRAVTAGRAFAFVLGGAGLAALVSALLEPSGDLPGGIWAMVLGWFLFNAAGSAGRSEGGDRPNDGFR